MTTVVALVPAKDRADSIAETVVALRGLAGVDRVLVVDDGSVDDTTDAARAAGAQVLRLSRNMGKGGAVRAGVEASPDADVYLLIDADVAGYASEAQVLLDPVLADEVDLTIGVLPSAGKRGGFGTIRKLSAWGVRRACGFVAVAPLSGQRAVRARFLRDLTSSGRFGLEVAMTIDAVNAGARVREIDVAMDHRHTGRSVAGFRHRGSQGIDIVGALWPRLTGVRIRRFGLGAIVLAFIALSFLWTSTLVPATVDPTEHASKVLIIGVPKLGLGDVDPATMPNLTRLTTQGAYGMMTVRTGGGSTSASAYASLGAGDRVWTAPSSAIAADRGEQLEGDSALDVVERRTGVRPPGAVLVPAMPSVRRSAGSYSDSKPGALGDALHQAGRHTAVVANSDSTEANGTVDRLAPAVLAVASSLGTVDHGSVSHDLVVSNSQRPFGLEIDQSRFANAVSSALRRADVVVVDPGETERAGSYGGTMQSGPASAMRSSALARTDALIGRIDRSLPKGTLLIVASVSPPTSSAQLVPIVFSGAGVVPGRLSSPSTSRPDLVTLTDLAPTVLQDLGVPVPASMIGKPILYRTGSVSQASLQARNDIVMSRDKVYPTFMQTFIDAQMVLYLIAIVAMLRVDTPTKVKRLLRFAMLTVATVPIMTFVVRLVPVLMTFGTFSNLLVWVLSAGVAWAVGMWRTHPLDPLLALSLFGVGLLSLDLATGANLQSASLLGYTPTAAARFVGIGNTSYAVLAAGAVIVVALLVARSSRPRDAWWLAAAIGLIAIVADGAPWMGSDVGGILSLFPVVAIVLYLLSGRRLNWRVVGIVSGATVALLAVVVGFEALQAPEHRDHIGRFFLGGSSGGTFWTTISRKISINISLLANSSWSRLIPLIGAFAVAVLLIGRGWRRLLPAGSAERFGFLGLLLVALFGWAANDSGPLVAALVFVYLGPYVALLGLAEPHRDDELLPPLESLGTLETIGGV